MSKFTRRLTLNRLTTLFLIILTLTTCQTEETEKVIIIDNKYSISIPSFLTEVNNLNEDASLQYQHAWKEFYVIVIDETKSEMQKALVDHNLADSYSNDIDSYCSLLLESFGQAISISRKSDIIDTYVNNMPTKLVTMSGRVEGLDVFYSLAFIEGKETYYQIMAWTVANKQYKYNEKMSKLIHSFKEF